MNKLAFVWKRFHDFQKTNPFNIHIAWPYMNKITSETIVFF